MEYFSEDPIGFAAGDSNLYRYVGNSPTNATDPTGQQANNPNAMEQRANPGSFTVRINRSMRAAGKGAVDCGQKDVEARYTPSAAEKAKYSKIFLTVYVRTDTKQHLYPDNVFGNDAWHLDRPKDPNDLVRWPDEAPNAAIWTDDPGQAPNKILLPGAKKSLEQEWEVVAWGIPKNGGKIELLGAVRYGFKAEWTYSACGDPCKCKSTVWIGNQKRKSETMTLENIPPQDSTMPFFVTPIDLSK